MIQDFAIISVLLVIGQILRSRVSLLQSLLIPAPILAGLFGLLGGDACFGILPFRHDDNGTAAMLKYPFELVAILFATLFLGYREQRVSPRTMVREVGDTFFYNLACEIGQYGFALLLGVILLMPLFPGLPDGFALLMPAGFAGGHGTATVVAAVLQQHGWGSALSIGYTFATIGILAGILGGLVLINIGVRLGWTQFVETAQALSPGERRGFLSEEEQTSLGRATVSSMSLEPLAWHLALALSTFALACWLNTTIKSYLPGGYSMPLFAVAMLVGAALQFALNGVGLGKFVDRQVMGRIGMATSDYLIAFGVASIQIQVVVESVIPIAIMSFFGVVYSVAVVCLLGPRMFRDNWFERSLFVFGWLTGTVAVSIMLLRIIDPNRQSRTLDDYGVAYVGIAPIEILLLVLLPSLVARQMIVGPAIVLILAAVACVLLSRRLLGWFSATRARPRAVAD